MEADQRLAIGMYNLEFAQRGGGEKRTLVLAAHWRRRHRVTLITDQPVDLAELASYFDVELDGVENLALADVLPEEPRSPAAAEARWSRMAGLGLDVFVNGSYGSTTINPAPLGIYMCMFPVPADATQLDLYARPPARQIAAMRAAGTGNLDTYAVMTSNSAFTADHIARRWSRPASTVYTPCTPVDAGPKTKVIAHVARFHPFKGQEHLIDGFQQSSKLVADGWQLHLAGSGSVDGNTDAYIDELRARAAGWPIHIRVNETRAGLVALYRQASIYWHATGFGDGFHDAPEHHEHFGQTVVEAMSAGAVPIVHGVGGPLEIVEDGVTGHHWSTPAELIEITERIAFDPVERARLAESARRSSRRFLPGAYCQRMDRILTEAISSQTRRRRLDHD